MSTYAWSLRTSLLSIWTVTRLWSSKLTLLMTTHFSKRSYTGIFWVSITTLNPRRPRCISIAEPDLTVTEIWCVVSVFFWDMYTFKLLSRFNSMLTQFLCHIENSFLLLLPQNLSRFTAHLPLHVSEIPPGILIREHVQRALHGSRFVVEDLVLFL